jgi:hypothetical protein
VAESSYRKRLRHAGIKVAAKGRPLPGTFASGVGAQGGEFRPEVALGIRRAWDAALRSVPSSRQGKLTLVSAPAPHFPGAGVFGTRCYRRRCCAYTRARDPARRASERVDLVDRLWLRALARRQDPRRPAASPARSNDTTA